MPAWVIPTLGILLSGGGIGAVLVFIATRKKDKQVVIAERFDDASELSRYIRAEIEKAVAPLREEIDALKQEKRAVHDDVRARETLLWVWDRQNRQGPIPELSAATLEKLGISHLSYTAGRKELL